jgi:nucleoside phosphorylase
VKRVAIFAALQWECTPIARRLRNAQRTSLNGCPVWRGHGARGEVWLVKTGIGLHHAHAAAQVIAEAASFDLFLSTGCAGALATTLSPGDMAVATNIVSITTAKPLPTDATGSTQARSIAAYAGVPSASGAVLCSPAVLASVADKRAAAARYGALAVEMEGEPLAICAANAGIPFVSARAILDTAETELRHAGRFVDPQTGRLRPFSLAAYLARHPSALSDLRDMQQMMQAAQRSLDRFFAAWLAAES